MISTQIKFFAREVALMHPDFQIEFLKCGSIARIHKFRFGRRIGYCISFRRNGITIEVFNMQLLKAKLQFIKETYVKHNRIAKKTG